MAEIARQFIASVIPSAREKRPEAEQYFKEAQRLVGSADVPAELQELGKVLQKIMLGVPADLSTLTEELREMVEKIMGHLNLPPCVRIQNIPASALFDRIALRHHRNKSFN